MKTTTSACRIVDGVTLVPRDLGEMPYGEALALQRSLHAEVVASRGAHSGHRTMYLLLVEHVPPVITISRRKDALRHLLTDPDALSAAGIEIAETDRGGDITYHGPGQLVVYPIIDLNTFGLRLHGYMRQLEEIVIHLLRGFEIAGVRDAGATGVWVPQQNGSGAAAKICAMGVRISRWVSMHGLALNVTTNLNHFELIVPCGLTGRTVTSMQRELGEGSPPMSEVKAAMIRGFARALGI